MALDRDPNHVLRDFVIPGMPSSGKWNVHKPEFRALLTEWWQVLIGLVADAGGLELPNLLINMSVTGGDENNIVAEANLPVPDGPGLALFSILTEEANTGPVRINDKRLLTSSGSELPAGGLVDGGLYLFLDAGDTYRLLSDYASSTILQAAEDAIDQANAAKDGAENAQAAAEAAQGATVAYRDQANGSAAAAATARDDIVALANATGPAKWYDTHALAVADLANISADQVVGIFTDETQAGLRSLYRKEGSALVFKTVLESDGLQAVNATRLGADPTGVADSRNAFIAAATLAKAIGSETITARPGLYRATGLSVDDILGCYLVGDGIKFVKINSPTSMCQIYPFSTKEWADRDRAANSASNNRGTIGIELDDALMIHWLDVFPLFKEMGATFGVVWPAHNGSEKWVKEAYRHGFDIIAHGLVNEPYATLTPEQIHTNANIMLDAIEGITGQRDNVAFVYPQHSHNAQSDDILRRYFIRGRGYPSNAVYPKGVGHPWNVSAIQGDAHVGDGEISENLKKILREIADSDGRALIFLHYAVANNLPLLASFRKLIEYCQDLGIKIDKPSKVVGRQQFNKDPFFEAPWGTYWGGAAGNNITITLTDEEKYGSGRSLKAENLGSTGQTLSVYTPLTQQVRNAIPGGFSLYRVKFRRKHGAIISGSGETALRIFVQCYGTSLENTQVVQLFNSSVGRSLAVRLGLPTWGGSVNTYPATSGWETFEEIVAIPANVTAFMTGVSWGSINAGQPPLYITDFTCEFIQTVPYLRHRVTLNGTTNVPIYTGIARAMDAGVIVTPRAPANGTISVGLPSPQGTFNIRSSDPTDTGIVDVVFTAPGFYGDLPFAVA